MNARKLHASFSSGRVYVADRSGPRLVNGDARMADIFISYSHEEYGVASAVQDFIDAHSEAVRPTSIFMADSRTLRGGDNWLEVIRRKLREARVVLSILSNHSITQPWIHFEAGAAWMDKVLIPLCFGRMNKGSMPAPYNQLHARQLREPADQYSLVCDLYHHLGIAGVPPAHHVVLNARCDDEHSLRKLYRNFTSLIVDFENE